MSYWKTGAFSPRFFSITAVGSSRKLDFQELVFSAIRIGMQSLNVSLDMCCEWACSLDVEQNIAGTTKGHLQKGEKTTLLPGGDRGDRKPQRSW